jgi:hypothetical protein
MTSPPEAVDAQAIALRDQLSLEEKLTLLSGVGDFWTGFLRMATHGTPEPFTSGSAPRVGVPGLRFVDGPRGITVGASTCAVAVGNPQTVVAIECGSAVLMERWRHAVPAILILWYPGMEGGHAFADILLGRARPTGRLPFAVPISEDHLPPFDPDAVRIDYGPLHGQRLLDHLGVEAAYPFGFGLNYAAATEAA